MLETLELDYNTSREKMIIPEYGRNVQNMIHHCISIAEKEERNKCAQAIIKVMGQLKPQLRDIEDFTHKLWAHLFIMADFKLDVDSPYPIPSKESFNSKPDRVEYPRKKIKYGHYGKVLEEMITAAVAYPEGEEKIYLTLRIANLLKTSYLLWNRDTVNDNTIVKQLEELSGGKLTADASKLEDTADILRLMRSSSVPKDITVLTRKKSNNNNRSNNSKGKQKNHKRNNR
jgi:hypothetical protein